MSAAQTGEQNKELIRRYFEARNRHEDWVSEFIATDYARPEPPYLKGIEAYREFVTAQHAAWEDETWTIQDLAADGDKVWAFVSNTATHASEAYGVPATGRSVAFKAVLIFSIAGDKITAMWRIADDLSRVRQLTAVPATQR